MDCTCYGGDKIDGLRNKKTDNILVRDSDRTDIDGACSVSEQTERRWSEIRHQLLIHRCTWISEHGGRVFAIGNNYEHGYISDEHSVIDVWVSCNTEKRYCINNTKTKEEIKKTGHRQGANLAIAERAKRPIPDTLWGELGMGIPYHGNVSFSKHFNRLLVYISHSQKVIQSALT